MPDARHSADDGGDRAQSEVMGYVIVFSTILIATSVVVVFGVSALEDVKSETVADNAEVAMQSVSADLEAISLGTAASRTSELSLQSGSLSTGQSTAFNVTGKRVEVDGSDPEVITTVLNERSINRTLRPIVYTNDGTDIAYENTLLIRDQQRGGVAVTDPQFSVSEDRAVLPVVATNATVQSVSGGTRQIHFSRTTSEGFVLSNSSTPERRIAVNVTVDTVPDRADVWERALESELGGMPTPDRSPSDVCHRPRDSTVACDFLTARLVTTGTNVTYAFG